MLKKSTIAQQMCILMHKHYWVSSRQMFVHYMCHNKQTAL